MPRQWWQIAGIAALAVMTGGTVGGAALGSYTTRGMLPGIYDGYAVPVAGTAIANQRLAANPVEVPVIDAGKIDYPTAPRIVPASVEPTTDRDSRGDPMLRELARPLSADFNDPFAPRKAGDPFS